MGLALGIDQGTSGTRACIVDAQGQVLAESRAGSQPYSTPQNDWVEQHPSLWWSTFKQCIAALPVSLKAQVTDLAIDGTSASVCLADRQGNALTTALMYNDARATAQAARIAQYAPKQSAARGATSSLAKVLWLMEATQLKHALVVHQVDWLNARLTGRICATDYNNALKLGYDVVRRQWPGWLEDLAGIAAMLPKVVAPGSALGNLHPQIASELQLPTEATLRAGTTDSTAAIIATGVQTPGEAVTSLGSTLVMKLLSTTPIFAPDYGIYSHRFGSLWLAGGASNSGGKVLLNWFSPSELEHLSRYIDPEVPSGLDFYPLSQPGERFPYHDPQYPPRIDTNLARDRIHLLHGLLEGVARIEARGYRRLAELGAVYPRLVVSTGGGAFNETWRKIRARILGCKVSIAQQTEAAYGSAMLASQHGFPVASIAD